MFEPGSLLYVHDFEFGNITRSKYLVVLCVVNGVSIVCSFTTSKQYVNESDVKDGIIKTPNKHCYCFLRNVPAGTNNFSFPKTTFIFTIQNARILPIKKLQDQYRIDYVCTINPDRFIDILYCFYTSEHTPQNIKRELDKLLKDLTRKDVK